MGLRLRVCDALNNEFRVYMGSQEVTLNPKP